MKKFVSTLLMICIAILLVACNNAPADPTVETTTPTNQTQGTVPTTPSSNMTEPSQADTEPATESSAPTVDPTQPSEPDDDPSVPTEPSHEHSYAATIVAPTCTQDGYTTYICDCGDNYVSDQVAATGHHYTGNVTASTCTDQGYTTYTCHCGDSYVGDKVTPTCHSYGDWVTTKEPTTTATGIAERKCANCAATENRVLDKLIEAHAHSYTPAVTQQPTCTADGVKTYTCSCGSSYTESIAATGHNYTSNVTTEPTCAANGIRTYTCAHCKGTYTESIGKLNHNYNATVVSPTCTEDGYTTHTCTGCGESYKDSVVKATGHSYDDGVVTKPTCEAEGYTTYTCTNCSYSYKADQAKATGHVYEIVSDTATCASDGTKTEMCTICGATQTSVSPATAHLNTTETRVEPTCSKDGSVRVTCADCGATVSYTILDSTYDCSYTEKMSLDVAAQEAYDKGLPYYVRYSGFEDYDVYVCSGCGDIDLDTMEFRYTEYEAAMIMLGYVNELRASVGVEPLELHPTFVEKANIAVKEYYQSGSKPSTGLTGNYVDGGNSIRHHFEKFEAGYSYSNMVNSRFKYFGYALYKDPYGGSNSLYAVQLFWDGKSPF